MVSAFITPFGLFEWLRMPFGLKNAPQIDQRLLDNALYGYIRIPEGSDQSGAVDVFQADRLLNACDQWNLSISVVKSLWVCRKVDYLGHRVPVAVVYASDWAISAALVQEHDGTYMPVTFTSRTLEPNELNYGTAKKRFWLISGSWIMADAIYRIPRPTGQLADAASPLDAQIVKCTRGEDEILDEELLVVSFDGSARVKRGGGACSAIVWKLPEWIVVAAESKYLHDLTVNEAEYQGLLLIFDLLSSLDRGRLIICGDSNVVTRQMRGEIECKAPGLTPLHRRALDRLRTWPAHEFLHVKRDWNQGADRLVNTALHQ
ncbi:hypothetical protein PPTG_07858 [Phytophthora nicotianae INRA-310]|uniref:RNase H type-1 domain-containing protein n=1 Tax=Phytophthora nicotianae (strain INRA-310) TaxID=761204 RepID=W2QNZ1_PHYN3|nr:hypothetical protein PPTG_07858 [Phytophthora nicotianae INRA-310]ETN14224.1 hypothetical protein PPTG_07858 [Phytophthora nicotianae INRA-310]